MELRTLKTPPIFVAGVTNITPLISLLENIAKHEYEIKIINDSQVKIQPETPEKYSIIIKELQARNTEFHTYKLQ